MKTGAILVLLSALLEGAPWRSDLQEARKLQTSGQSGQADSVYEHMINNAQGLPPSELNSMALELFYAARYREAEPVYHQALAGWERLGPPAARDHIVTAANLGALLRAEGRYMEAESLLLDCLRQAETIAGKDSLEWGRGASGLAALYLVWEKLPQAESFALQAKTILEQRLPDGDTERVNNMSILGSIYMEQGRYGEAEAVLRATLASARPRLATRTYNELAVVALRRHQLDQAESLALQALDVERQSASPGGPLSAVIRNNLAEICLGQKRYVDAEQHYREAIAIWESIVGKQHPDTAKGYMNLAALYHQRGREAGAEELYRRAAGIMEATLGKDHLVVLVTRNELADVLRAEGRYTEAERLGRESLTELQQKLEPDDPRVLRALANQARLLASTRRPKEAAALRDQILQMSQGFRKQE